MCIRCGAPTSLPLAVDFHWAPPWLYVFFPLLPLLVIVAGVLQLWQLLFRRPTHEWMRALYCYCQLPLCRRHRTLWEIRKLASVGCLFVLPFIGVFCRASLELVGIEFVLTAFALWSPWLVLAGWVQVSPVRVTEITDTTLTFNGVSEQFVLVMDRAERDRLY